jgi:hypothetical protein
MALVPLTADQLAAVHGGLTMPITQYGYRGEETPDSETERGNGAYRKLEYGQSVALSDAALRALGLTRSDVTSSCQWVQLCLPGGGTLVRRIDDRAPQQDCRADLYQPGGFDARLPDHADVRLLGTIA